MTDIMNLATLAKYLNEDEGLIESVRWPGGPVCPHPKDEQLAPKPKRAQRTDNNNEGEGRASKTG